MNFVETLFGITPDAGSGSLETALVAGVALIATLAIMLLNRNKERPVD